MSEFSSTSLKAALPSILAALPYEWKGTTFNNSNLLGRHRFCENVKELVARKSTTITSQDLVDLGNAEDYLRVSTNITCLLELVYAVEAGFEIDQIFSFGSSVMPIIAVALTSSKPVHLYLGGNEHFFTKDLQSALSSIGCDFHIHTTAPESRPEEIVVALGSKVGVDVPSFVDAFVNGSVLFINNPSNVVPAKVLVIRKRLITPMSTPAAEKLLQQLAGVPITADTEVAEPSAISEFFGHLQVLSGTEIDPTSNPVCFTAGLAALASFYLTLIAQGGADIVMASTSYGGSSELTDICSRSPVFNKHTYDITGNNDIILAIQATLDGLASNPASLMPLTVLFIEVPTNPDMKVPEINALVNLFQRYAHTTGKQVMLLIDTTFAPGSKVIEKVHSVAPELTTMVFISMSKSVSRGVTTAGAIVAGSTPESKRILSKVREMSIALDSGAKPNQVLVLVNNHHGVEERCANAYNVAVRVGEAIRHAVETHCGGYDMPLAFVTPEMAQIGFSSSTFSFNLPPIPNVSEEVNEGLAQRFVDILCLDKVNFKPCVSFGQDNGLVYCTVPATSTQGAIKKEDKAKQAVGGVQLTRLSFPPSCNLETICEAAQNAIIECYRI